MGASTIITGYIEPPFYAKKEMDEAVFRKNRATIKRQPSRDVWPPMHEEFFSFSSEDYSHGSEDGRIVFFGGKFVNLELKKEEWLEKFESVLKEMVWLSAVAYLQSETSGLEILKWAPTESQALALVSEPLAEIAQWNFSRSALV